MTPSYLSNIIEWPAAMYEPDTAFLHHWHHTVQLILLRYALSWPELEASLATLSRS